MPSDVNIELHGVVGWEISSRGVRQALRDAGDAKTIRVRLNSPGGDVFEGFAIYNALVQHKARVEIEVDALAASAASVIAMAGDSIRMPENAMMMIHDPSGLVIGSAEDMRAQAVLLDKLAGSIAGIYAARTGISKDELVRMMAEETWLDAREAKARGFATAVTPNKAKPDGTKPSNSLPVNILGFRRAPAEKLVALGFEIDASQRPSLELLNVTHRSVAAHAVPSAAPPKPAQREFKLGDFCYDGWRDDCSPQTKLALEAWDRERGYLRGRRYEELSNLEKHDLLNSDREHFNRMRDSWIARGKPEARKPPTDIYEALAQSEADHPGFFDDDESGPKLELVKGST